VPAPRRRLAGPYATVAGYRTRRGRRHFAVLPDPAAGDLGTSLDALAGAAGRGVASLLLAIGARGTAWRPFGRLTLGAPVPPATDAALAFDPVVRQVPGLVPDGRLQHVRAGAYAGSRRGRRATLPARTPPR
jgi:hypothetical protein